MSNLPIHLIERILYQSNLDIDTRLALKMKPRRINRLFYNFLLTNRTGYTYNAETQTLHVIEKDTGAHIVRRPIILDYAGEDFAIFNSYENEYMVDISEPNGDNCMYPCNVILYIFSGLLRFK